MWGLLSLNSTSTENHGWPSMRLTYETRYDRNRTRYRMKLSRLLRGRVRCDRGLSASLQCCRVRICPSQLLRCPLVRLCDLIRRHTVSIELHRTGVIESWFSIPIGKHGNLTNRRLVKLWIRTSKRMCLKLRHGNMIQRSMPHWPVPIFQLRCIVS